MESLWELLKNTFMVQEHFDTLSLIYFTYHQFKISLVIFSPVIKCLMVKNGFLRKFCVLRENLLSVTRPERCSLIPWTQQHHNCKTALTSSQEKQPPAPWLISVPKGCRTVLSQVRWIWSHQWDWWYSLGTSNRCLYRLKHVVETRRRGAVTDWA